MQGRIMREVNIEAGWKDRLANEFAADYMGALSQFLHAEKAAAAHATSQLSEQPCCGCVLRARALPRNSAAVPEWAAAAATARAAEVETALEETARGETGAAAGTAKDVGETARRHKTHQQDGSRASTTR